MIITKENLKDRLKTTTAKIKFKKMDQTVREMSCTLSSQFLPEMKNLEGKKVKIKPENPDNITVWDLDKQAWRSFRVDSILDYSFQTL